MWVSRPGFGLETNQNHFFDVLVLVSTLLVLVLASLVLVSEGGLQYDLRLCATATLLVSKVASECAPLFTNLLFDRPISVFVHYYIYCSAIFKCR